MDKYAIRNVYGEYLVELGKKYSNIVVLDADLAKSTKTINFEKAFPERFFDMGISEADMMGTAAGLASTGKIVFVSTFAIFATGRAWDQVRNTIAYSEFNVKICATHAGITVGEDGASHQAIEDIALMSSIPKMQVFIPSDKESVKKIMDYMVEYKGPVYMRMPRSSVPVIYEDKDNISYKYEIVKPIEETVIISSGVMTSQALDAADKLEKDGISVGVIDLFMLKPLPEELSVILKNVKNIVVVEEHNIYGGMGSILSRSWANKGFNWTFIAIDDKFGRSGTPEALLKYYGIDSDSIYRHIRGLYDKI